METGAIAMADTAVPRIRVTDPQSRNGSPMTSPAKDTSDMRNVGAKGARGSPAPDGAKSPPTSNIAGRVSPNRQRGEDAGQERETPYDPLTQQVLKRSTTAQRLALRPEPSNSSAQDGDSEGKPSEVQRTDSSTSLAKEKKKGVSFLGRFLGNKKKEPSSNLGNINEGESVLGDDRPEGMNAQLFSQPFDNMGFNPYHPQPPKYIKMRSRNKTKKDFDRLFLAQELRVSGGTGSVSATGPGGKTIWAMEFSKDGKYLAAGGQDKVLWVWAVISNAEERRTHEKEEQAANEGQEGQAQQLSAPVFRTKPLRAYEGHTGPILDISWSKNNFLLSSSMDKTVRIWHVTRPECLCTFQHHDFVPSIQFHPRDDRFFLSGSLDAKIRLWSVPDKSVACVNQLPEMITAVSFTPDGKTAIAGCANGLCMFYETENMKYQTQIHVRSTHGKNARGSKITGIHTTNWPPDNPSGDVKVLISSNDSRIRLYNYRDKSLEMKFKSNENSTAQIRASFSDDLKYVISGSEDRKAYIWSTGPGEGDKRDKRPVEMFDAHNTITTCALMAPTKTRQLLSASEDPVYDICNPPPVTLISRAESEASFRPETDNGSVQVTPAEGSFRKPEASPQYLARTAHPGGNIIVTADYNGNIKVYRQDCAFSKRKSDTWETSSVFSKRYSASFLGRTTSVATRGSGKSVDRSNSVTTQPPSDRILSWRQNISNSSGIDQSGNSVRRSQRSVSPRKSLGQSSFHSHRTSSTPFLNANAYEANSNIPSIITPAASSSPSLHKSSTEQSVPSSMTTPPQTSHSINSINSPSSSAFQTPTAKPSTLSSPSKSPHNSTPQQPQNNLYLEGDTSNLFWNKSTWRDQATHATRPTLSPDPSFSSHPNHRPGSYLLPSPQASPSLVPSDRRLSKRMSIASALTSEGSVEEEDESARGGGAEKEMVCRSCGGREWKAKVVKGQGTRLVCGRCGVAAE